VNSRLRDLEQITGRIYSRRDCPEDISRISQIDIVVQNVSLSELTATPFKAAINFQKVLYTPGTRHERARETFVAHVDFVLRDHVPNAFVRVNPLGLQVAYFRVDQAFEEASK